MLRRNLVAAAALFPVLALANKAYSQEASLAPADSPDAEAMGEAEIAHAEETGMVGALSLLQSRMATSMATDEKVKMFATWEVVEQETIGDILNSIKASPDEAQGALMPPTDEEAMAMLDETGKAKLDEMKALSGAEFDTAYVTASLEGHQQLLAIQEEYLTVGTNREHLSVAKLARGMITEHIAHLEELQSSMT